LEKRHVYRLLVGKPEGKIPLGRPVRRRMNNIKMDLGEIGWGGVDCIGLSQDRNKWRDFVNSVMNFVGVAFCSLKCWETIEWLHNCGLSSGSQLHRVIFSMGECIMLRV
jgi:hypothetical protein